LTISADSSFFVSLYLVDRYSIDAWHRMSSNPAVWLTPLNRAEIVHATYAHVFWKKSTLLQAASAVANFERNCASGIWRLIELPPGAFDRSIDLARRYSPTLGVRTLDSLHVACALELRAKKFWTFDDRQAELAKAVGLDTTP
jgi:predicted nucleic acid-binding protein